MGSGQWAVGSFHRYCPPPTAHCPLAPLGRETAAILAVGGDAMLSHHSAASVWGLCPATGDEDPIDVLTGARQVRRRCGIITHRTSRLTALNAGWSAEPSHSKAFWRYLGAATPGRQQHVRWLRARHGTSERQRVALTSAKAP